MKGYKYRINQFYRWVLNHTNIPVDKELAYPTPKLVKKQELSREQTSRRRIEALLDNELLTANRREDRRLSQEELKAKYPQLLLDEGNLNILKDFYTHKTSSGKVESNIGFVSKIYFLKRLGLFLKGRGKTYKEATMKDIQDFIEEVRKSIASKKQTDKSIVNCSYKAHLLDFYRYVYGMFGEEQPRKYPDVVSWLYQGRKKSHDKVVKEVIPDHEIKAMIERCTETRDKALLALLADSSARVGEIVNCNIGDLKINEIQANGAQYSHLIATIILRGKTGERTNTLFYSVPYIRLWLLNHPLKEDPKAPLFTATKESRYGQRLSAVGINKILQRAARRAGISRHVHAHLFRHTNATRMAKILSEQELKIHSGWGAESKMTSTYVHLDEKDVGNKILECYGIITQEDQKKEELLEIHVCPNTICSYQNPPEAKFCLKCGYPTTMKTAVELKRLKEQEEELHQELMERGTQGLQLTNASDIREVLYQALKSDGKSIEKLQKLLNLAKSLS